MNISARQATASTLKTDCAVVAVFERGKLSSAAEELDAASKGYLSRVIRRGDMRGRVGDTLMLHDVANVQARRVLLLGCGTERALTPANARKALAAAAAALNGGRLRDAGLFLDGWPLEERDLQWLARAASEALLGAAYRFDELKSKPDTGARPLKKAVLGYAARRDAARAARGVQIGSAIAQGVNLARDLANRPANLCTPRYLAEQARSLQRGQRRLKVEVLDEKQMEKLGMGSLLSVARGSHEPPRLIVFEYRAGGAKQKPVVLVGKGVTFDTGGISIKPAAAMDEMKFDMCGAASVFGTVKTCLELELPVNLVGLVPATENMPDGRATKPGDVVTSMSGQTIEVLNTDAEGRLILADALSYAQRYDPDVVIDIATLTGACVVALGEHASGLLSNNPRLAQALLDAGEQSGDRCWQLPLWDEYQEQLKSNFADMANIGGRSAGTITAACFLSRFTQDYRWAHLDIAGTAWRGGPEKGATGRPVPALVQYLLARAPRTRK